MSLGEQAGVAGAGDTSRSPHVFVSYSHDSEEHKEAVRQFATFLRTTAGLDVHVDRWYDDGRRDWSLWAIDQLKRADYVIVIASPEYRRRADGAARPDEGRGAQFEAAMIRDGLTRDLAEMVRRVLPVVLPGRSIEDIPGFLNAYSTTHYLVPELTLDGIDELMVAITGVARHSLPPLGRFVPPTRAVVHPVVVTKSLPPVIDGEILSAGAQATIGARQYLVHADYFDERPVNDHSAICRQSRALWLGAPNKHVWIRQVEVVQHTAVSEAAVQALRREYQMLADAGDQGLPKPHALGGGDRLITMVTSWAKGESAGTLAEFLPRHGEVVDPGRVSWLLRGIGGLCHTLGRVHARGCVHRALAPSAIVVLDKGRFVLRDLGLAAVAYQPGEGEGDYQAPEQQRRRSGRTGPWTDVHQIAAVTCHLLTGRVPAPVFPLPMRNFIQGLSPAVYDVLDRALSADPAARPEMADLAAKLSQSGPAF
jgi:hypothetical protein